MRLARILAITALVVAPSIAFAQSFTGTMVGTIKDSSGAAIPHAAVTITSQQTGRQAVGHRGSRRTLHVAAAAARGVPRRGQPAGLPHAPRARTSPCRSPRPSSSTSRSRSASSTEAVEVTASAGALETTSSTVGKVVDNRRILELPLNTRNVYSLIFLTPGVAGTIGNNYNSMSYSVNGARPTMMDTVIDGVTASFPTVNGFTGISVFPSVDAIQEFKVMGANYPAEYGRSLGSVLNVVYKSGTNDFHGSAYEFFRDSAFDANNYFAKRAGTPLGDFQRSQFGGVAGGPIRRGRTFFMTSYEGLREDRAVGDDDHRAHAGAAQRRLLADLRAERSAHSHLRPVHDAAESRRAAASSATSSRTTSSRPSAHGSGGAPGAQLLSAAESARQRRHRRAELLRHRHRRAERRQHRRAGRSQPLGQGARRSSATRTARPSARRRRSSPRTSPSPKGASTSRTSPTTPSSTTAGRCRTPR